MPDGFVMEPKPEKFLSLKDRLRAHMGAGEEDAETGTPPEPGPTAATEEPTSTDAPRLPEDTKEEPLPTDLKMPTFGQASTPKASRLTRLAASLPAERAEWIMRLFETYREPGNGIPVVVLSELVAHHAEEMSTEEARDTLYCTVT